MTYALGIDLGTTFSAAAITENGRTEIFELGNRNAAIPSVVVLRNDGEVLIGEAAERRAQTEPLRTAREFKRRLGDPTPILLGGTPYSAEALMARLLRTIVNQVVERKGEAPSSIVISHPANYGPYKLDLMEQAVRQAEIGSVGFITEPMAAALHYAEQERIDPGQVVAIYDFGGGTFDAALLRRTQDSFEQLGEPEGLERLGGIDFDEAVFSHVMNTIGHRINDLDLDDPATVAAISRLRDQCRDAKEALSEDTDVTIPVALPGIQTDIRLTRAEFEEMIVPRIGETISALNRAVRSAGLQTSDIDKILLVGGTSRIPLVRQKVREATGAEVVVDAHPKHAISLGAAAAADRQLSGVTMVAVAAPPTIQTRQARKDSSGLGAAAAGAAAIGAMGAASSAAQAFNPPASGSTPRSQTPASSSTPPPTPPPMSTPLPTGDETVYDPGATEIVPSSARSTPPPTPPPGSAGAAAAGAAAGMAASSGQGMTPPPGLSSQETVLDTPPPSPPGTPPPVPPPGQSGDDYEDRPFPVLPAAIVAGVIVLLVTAIGVFAILNSIASDDGDGNPTIPVAVGGTATLSSADQTATSQSGQPATATAPPTNTPTTEAGAPTENATATTEPATATATATSPPAATDTAPPVIPTKTPDDPCIQVPPGRPAALITNITEENNDWKIEFVTCNISILPPAGIDDPNVTVYSREHTHFFYDTVTQEEAGVPGAGPWTLYGGPSPYFPGVVNPSASILKAERPPGADRICVLIANTDHSVKPDTGNCFNLP